MATSKNVIYDSVNDKSTGRKRAVESTGGVSVAERARLFGTQIKVSSTSKDPPSQRPPVNKQPIKSNIVHQERNYQPLKTDVNRYPKQDSSYSSSQRIPNNYRPPPIQNTHTPKREYSSSSTDLHNYRQQSIPTYDTSRKQASHHASYTQIIPSESYTSDDAPYFESYDRPNTNYFQPIQDPLEALYTKSSQYYSQPQIPMSINNNIDGMQLFDVGNLINRIQQDYLNNVRPYVSSVQFIENEQNLGNMGFVTPSTTRKNYTRRRNDISLRKGASYHYDIIDTNGFYPGYSKPLYNRNNPSSMNRRKHHRRYHDQASSPIHIYEPSAPTNPRESSPATPVQKLSTPVAESSSEEEEEEESTTADTQAEDSKATEAETSVESEDEPSEKAPAPIKTETPTIQRNGIPRSTVPNPTPAKSSDSESSGSEESESDSDTETEDEEPKPSPAIRSNPSRTTPQSNTRGIPQRTTPQTNTRGIPQRTTPQTNTRGLPQRTTTDDNDIDQPPESWDSVDSFNVQDSKKSSGIGNKLRSIKNRFYGR